MNGNTQGYKKPIGPVDRCYDEDFSEKHEWDIDKSASHKYLSRTSSDDLAPVYEIMQNHLDSKDKGQPNNISFLFDKSGDPSEPFLTSSDEGDGVTKYHEGDIMKFIESRKGISTKQGQGDDWQRMGLGMLQYANLCERIIITSMDEDFLYRIPIFRTEDGVNCYGKVTHKPTKAPYFDEFKMYRTGTRVACFKRHEWIEPISPTTLRKQLVEKFAMRLYDNPKVNVFVDDKQVTVPVWIQEHPPQVMGICKVGSSKHNDIRGNMWRDDQNGNGRINVYQNGYLVEALQIDARKCKGYVEYNVPATDNARTSFIPSPELTELKNWLRAQMIQMNFPRTDAPVIDKRERETILELGTAILGQFFSNTTYPGSIKQQTAKSITTTTDPAGSDFIGYGFNPEPDTREPTGPIVKGPANPDNVHKIGEGIGEEHGGVLVKVQNEQVKHNRRPTYPFGFQEAHLGPDLPLWNVSRGYGSKGVTLIQLNLDNAESPMYKGLPGGIAKSILIGVWLAEIRMNEAHPNKTGLPDYLRMKHSRFRVDSWRAANLFPKGVSDKSLMNPRGRQYL
jgi:hypothetical protein